MKKVRVLFNLSCFGALGMLSPPHSGEGDTLKMVRIMDANTGKKLDEACNRYNDVYGDEVLYAAWAEPPRSASATANAREKQASAPLNFDVDGFMARLYACQG